MRLHRIALGPVRAASRTGREVLSDEAARVVDAALAGPLPEVVARSLVEQRVIERVAVEMLASSGLGDGRATSAGAAVEQALRSPALERWVASEEATRLTELAANRIVRSPAFQRAVAEMLSSPEVRRALAEGAGGVGAEAAAAARIRGRSLDDRIETRAHKLVGRRGAARLGFAGVATRGAALIVDAALAQALYLLAAFSVGLILALVGSLHRGWLTGSLSVVGWALVVAVYFVGFWSADGRTPGMRLLRLRVAASSGAKLSVLRALVRLVGLILAIIPLGAGFLPALFDSRRRALPDYLAGTVVRYDVEGADTLPGTAPG
jgi:uncharacterized RDD family membrane protein YckC